MKSNTRFFGLALGGVIALLLPLKADAICPSGISFQGYPLSTITGTTNGPSLRANFWTLGGGNPTLGAGNDNGAITAQADWIIDSPAGWAINGSWDASNYDGCPDVAQPNTDLQRMVVSLSDVDALGNMTYAVACVDRDTQAASQFGFDGVGEHIALVVAPKANITNTVRAGTEATITVASPDFNPGHYTDGSVGCELASVIPQYEVFKQTTGRGIAPSTSNDATAPTWVSVGIGNTGAPLTFTTTCGTTNCDNYLAVVPRYNSGFTTADAATGSAARVSQKSGNVQAGPTLAVTPKPKKIKNEAGGQQRQD